MPREPFLPLLRELARCYQAFESYSAVHIRGLGLTPAQFDILATLGNTAGMSFKELGEKTLITKGTLTGVVDRLEAQRLVRRDAAPDDGRSFIVSLTPAGERRFERAFSAHLDHLRRAMGGLDAGRLRRFEDALRSLRAVFEAAQPSVAAGCRGKARRPGA